MDHAVELSWLPDRARRFMDLLGLTYPIIQAGMDGAATPTLVSAVSAAGGLGTLPLTWRSPSEAAAQVKAVQEATSNPFSANYVLNFSPASLDDALAAGVKWVQFSWGLPDAYLVDKLRGLGVGMGIQVTGGDGARRALDLGADFLICQGREAGGHVQADQPLFPALDEVLAVAGDVPVAAAGGIADGRGVRAVLDAGAAAAVLGTRFVATQESAAHRLYKDRLLEARGPQDTVLTVCLNKVWPNATHRILRNNATFRMWTEAGCPPGTVSVPDGPLIGNRPGENDVVAVQADGVALDRYMDNVPVADMPHCDVDGLGTFAGFGVGEIDDIPTAADLIQRLMAEAGGVG